MKSRMRNVPTFNSSYFSETLEGKVVRIVGGDTLILLDTNNILYRARLDTPERG